jgi:hypothetical protein
MAREAEVKRFFEELKHVDAEAYRVLPESIEEWEREENIIYKAVTVVLYTYWSMEDEEQPEKILRELYNGWYGYESPYIFRVEPINKDEVTVTILKKREDNLYELITDKTIEIPEKFGCIPTVLFP